MHRVHPWLVAHKVFQIVLDGFCNLDLMAFDLALKPQTQTRMVDAYKLYKLWLAFLSGLVLTCDSSYVHLLDGVLVHDLLESLLGLLISVLVVLHYNITQIV